MMMAMQPASAATGMPGPCPGPVVTSAAHAERCRACGKCSALARLFDASGKTAGDTSVRIDFTLARRRD